MVSRVLAIAFILISCTFAHANGAKLTLDEAWQLMSDYDPGLKASLQLLDERKGKRTSALSVFLPQVEGKASIRSFVNEEGFLWNSGALGFGNVALPATEKTVARISAGVEQLIFDSGKSIASYKATTYGVAGAKHSIFANRQNRAVYLVRAYCEYYLSWNNLEAAKAAATALSEHERVARLRYQQDLVPRTDVLSAEVSASRAMLGVTKARDRLDVSAIRLETLIGMAPGAIAKPSVPLPPGYVSSPIERPELKVKTAEINAAKYEARSKSFSYFPEVYARVQTSYIDDKFRINKSQVLLWGGIRVPIFDGRYHWGQRNTALAKARRNRYEREAMEKDFSVELEDATREWQRSDKEISVASLNRGRSSANLRDARLNYSEGMISALEVRDAVSLWYESEYQYYKSICDKQIAAARLRQAAGVNILDPGGINVQ